MKLSDKEKTKIMLDSLNYRYSSWGRDRTNVIFPELRLGSGYCGVAQRRIDMFVISSNMGNVTTAFEIKASRSDFKKDINDDLKQRGARLFSNYFYYVAPKGMIKIEEIPIWAGLMEYDFDKYKGGKEDLFIETISAPLHDRINPTWGLICAIIRHVNKDYGSEKIKEQEETIRKLKYDNNEQKRMLEQIADGTLKPENYGWALRKWRK